MRNSISDAGNSKDEALMQILGKYRKNEEIYKGTIQKLQENNQDLIEEIIHLKELRINKSLPKSKH